ncbi:MAG: hypothetical protein ACP5I4_05820 [Oceanipulchritudo sp.]
MDRETSRLLIKSNRVLGTRLVEAGLTSLEDMDRANEVFIEFARQKDIRRASLLRVLIYDNQTLKEESLLDYQLENYPVGAVMLENYNIDEELLAGQSLEVMRASWSIPIDCIQGRWVIATAYYMSDVVREFWEQQLKGRITWYISPLGQLEIFFEERFHALEDAANASAEEPQLTRSEA